MSSGGDVSDHTITTTNLESLSSQLAEQILLGGAVIFFHNEISHFMYIRRDDKEMWKEQWADIKKKVRTGVITAVKSDNPIVVEASGPVPDRMLRTPLYPMLVVFRQVQCPAYFLLKQSGDISLIDYTPYFFTKKKTRDDAVSALLAVLNETQT